MSSSDPEKVGRRLRATFPQGRHRLVDAALAGLGGLGALDGENVAALVAVGQALEEPLGLVVAGEGSAKSGGTTTWRGVSSSMSTSTSSPAATPALARSSALTPTMNAPPITATVLL